MNNLSNIQNTMKKTTASVTNNKKTDTKKSIKEYILIAVGVTLYVSAWKALLLPYTIVGGGATGICAIIYFISENILGQGNGIPIWVSFLILNSSLLIVAIKLLGMKFCIRTIYGVTLMTLLFKFMPEAEMGQFLSKTDSLLACILGGVMAGTGLGIIYTNNGSTGGTDIIAIVVNKYRSITLGRILLYAVLTFSVDMYMNGVRQSVQFFIFSQKYEEIADRINQEAHRGVTLLDGMGWYSKRPIKVITVLVRKSESARIFKLVKEIDPHAFVSQSAAAGVYGEGFDAIKGK